MPSFFSFLPLPPFLFFFSSFSYFYVLIFFQWLPSFYFPSASLQPVGIIFDSLSTVLQSTRISKKGASKHILWPISFSAAILRMPLDYMGLESRVAYNSKFHGTVTIRNVVLSRPLSPGHHIDSRLKHIVVFLWKRPTGWSWRFDFRGRLQIRHTSRGYGGTLKEYRPGNAIFSPSYYRIPVSPRKELIDSPGASIFVTAVQGVPPDYLALGASGSYACGLIALHIFACFKSCCLRIWLLISLSLGPD